MLAIRIYYLFLGLMTVACTGNEIPMFGLVGGSVRLACSVPIADRPIVEWSDIVWTSNANLSLIFHSERNPGFEVHAFHQNANNYIVDTDFALTIDALDMDADPGQYTCRSTIDGTIYERHYYLTVGELPTCSGDVVLSEGQSTTLGCEMTYSGQQPLLQWFRGGHLVPSDDEYDIRLAKKAILLEATHSDNRAEYACRMSLGDVAKECSLILNVSYLVREIKFLPERERFRVGDELKCSARGNPAPRISLLGRSAAQGTRSGPGWQSLIIGQSWEGQRVIVQCTAKNTVDHETETLSSNITIHVTASKKQTTQSLHTEHQNVHTVRSATLPTVKRKDKEYTRSGGYQKKHHPTAAPGGTNHPVPKVDIEQHDTRYAVNHETTDLPIIKSLDVKERQRATEDSAPDVAGRMNHFHYSTALIVVHLILSHILK